MPRHTDDKHRAAYMPFRCDQNTYDTIVKISQESHKSQVQVLRELVEQGLVATGYKQDTDYLAQLIQGAVKTVLQPQVERLASISAKAAQIAGAAFFMNVYMGQLVLPPGDRQLVEEAAGQARKLGIEYLKLKSQDIDSFITSGTEKIIDI